VSEGLKTIIYPVSDLQAAKAVFTALLETDPYIDESYYVGYRVADQEIGLDPGGKGLGGPLPYSTVGDIEAALRSLLDAGAELQNDIKDVGGGTLIATVTDRDSNAIGLLQRV